MEILNDEDKFISQIEIQADHIMRMYQDDELYDKMIELAREWFYKGLKRGLEIGEKIVEELKANQQGVG